MKRAIGLGIVALSTVLTMGSARPSAAQDPPGAAAPDPADKPVNLDVENGNLYSTLSLLFTQAKVDYALDPSLKQYQVTGHLHGVKLRAALESLLKQANPDLTYRVENGIYGVITKPMQTDTPETGTTTTDVTPPEKPKAKIPVKIYSFELRTNAAYIAFLLGPKASTFPPFQPGFGGGGLGGQSGFGGGGGQGGFGGGQGGFGGGQGGFGGGGGGFGGGGGGFGGGGGGFGGQGGGFGGQGGGFGGQGGGFGGGGGRFGGGGGGFGGGGGGFGGGGGGGRFGGGF